MPGWRSRTVRSSGTARSAAAVPGARPTDTAPGQPLPGRLHVDPRLLALAQDQLRVAVQHLARLGRRHAALGPHQQLLAHLALQRGELLAQRRLGDVQDVGGLGQAADVDDLHEVLQAPEVHRCLPAPRRSTHDTISDAYMSRANSSWPRRARGWRSVRSQRTKTGQRLWSSSHIAERVRRIKPSPSTSAADRANELRREGRSIVNLVVGEPDFDTPAHIREAAAARHGRGRHPLHDCWRARSSCARRSPPSSQRENGLTYDITEIIVTNGAKSAIYSRLRRTLDAGDEVIVPAPYWVSYPDTGARLRRRAGARRLPRGAGLQADARAARGGDHAADALAGPQLAVEPDRRDLHRRRVPRAGRSACPPPARAW